MKNNKLQKTTQHHQNCQRKMKGFFKKWKHSSVVLGDAIETITQDVGGGGDKLGMCIILLFAKKEKK